MINPEAAIRLAAFVGVLGVLMVLEAVRPRRVRTHPRARRWPSNLGIVALNTLVVRVAAPLGVVGAAVWAGERGVGLFNLVAAPPFVAAACSFVLLDLAVWAQHVAFHKVPLFWRFHRMHHADTDFDATTGLRFHPGEILVSLAFKSAVAVALGAPPVAVLLFEIVLNATAMFNHSNLRLPAPLDRSLRWLLVTPDMHRVHHSVLRDETDSNYGFNFPWWDRALGTYRAQPMAGHEHMTIGLPIFRDAAQLRLKNMLLQPFRQISRQ